MIQLRICAQDLTVRGAYPRPPRIVDASMPTHVAADRVAAYVSDAIELELAKGGNAVTLLVEVDVWHD